MSTYTNSILSGGAVVQQNCWMRRIQIVFESKYKITRDLIENDETDFIGYLYGKYPGLEKEGGLRLTIGDDPGDNYAIYVNGTKNLALTADSGVIRINNLSYNIIALITALKLYRLTVNVGYRSNDSLITVARGEVSYIQQKIRSRRDTETYISFASELVAGWSQNRINFSMRSGTNIYDMFYRLFIGQGAPVNTVEFDKRLRNMVASNILTASGNTTNAIDMALASKTSTNLLAIADGSADATGKIISITDISEKRVIPINKNFINIANGNPTVTQDGLDIELFPVFNLVPGDIIQIDNRIIDTSQGMTTTEGVLNNYNTNYMNPDGLYILKQINYTFENRGTTFLFRCKGIALNLYKALQGVN